MGEGELSEVGRAVRNVAAAFHIPRGHDLQAHQHYEHGDHHEQFDQRERRTSLCGLRSKRCETIDIHTANRALGLTA